MRAETDRVAQLGASLLDEVERAVVGKRDVLELMLMALLADGHVLIEDFPGLAKTQAALLEAMQERQVTVDGTTRQLERPFLVVATQNPIEYEGTYPLPEAQLDRFIVRIGIGYPTPDNEWKVLEDRLERRTDDIELKVVVDAETLRGMQTAVEDVHVSEAVGRYIVALVAATRQSNRVLVGASPRGSLAVMKVARARAILQGRSFVTPDDVKTVAAPALAHRLILRPELWVQDIRSEDIIDECLETVPTPPSMPDS